MDKNVYDQVVENVMSVTDQEFANLTVAVLAYSFKINRYKLSRQFKRQTDMTLEEFLYKEKMARAAFLLKTFDNITVKEVSKRIGFCTCDYFIRKFKQYYGVAPGRYKEYKAMFPGFGGRKNMKQERRGILLKRKTAESGDCSKAKMDGRGMELKSEKPCAQCYYKSFALNNGNWK